MINPRSNEVHDASGFRPFPLGTAVAVLIFLGAMAGIVICFMGW